MADLYDSTGTPDGADAEVARLQVENQQLRIELTQALHAMAAREVIEQAKGLVLGHYRCTAPQAFAVLRLLSQQSNTKLRELSVALVEAAERGDRVHHPGLDAAATMVLADGEPGPASEGGDGPGPAGWR